MIGSLCFALGSMPSYVHAVGIRTDNATYFIGSIFFTTAAALQFRQTVKEQPSQSRTLDVRASYIQLVGTVFFNVTTLAALHDAITTAQEADRQVWFPDAAGSVCFLVASGIAWWVVARAWLSWRPHDRNWWIAALNLAGSIAFGASAIASWVVPDTDTYRNAAIVNAGTCLGAVGFFVGALLLLPQPASGYLKPTSIESGPASGST